MDDIFDQYDDYFDQMQHYDEKVFDDPIINDPLSLIENSIAEPWNPPDALDAVELSIEGSSIPGDPYGSTVDPPIIPRETIDNRMYQMPGDPLPDPCAPSKPIHWKQPPLPSLNPGLPKFGRKPYTNEMGKTVKEIKNTVDEISKGLVYCIKKLESVSHVECLICDYFDKKLILFNGCRVRARESARLAGEKTKKGK